MTRELAHLCVVACDLNGAIGLPDGRIPWQAPLDQHFFRHVTIGSVVWMGRKTFDSLKRPLPGRGNIVLTRRLLPESEDKSSPVVVVDSFEKVLPMAIKLRQDYPFLQGKPIFCIGGGSVYHAVVMNSVSEDYHVDGVILTRIPFRFEDAGVFFPLDRLGDFELLWESEGIDPHLRKSLKFQLWAAPKRKSFLKKTFNISLLEESLSKALKSCVK